MQYRVIALGSVGAVRGLAEDAKAALELAADLKKQGYEQIVIKDEFDRSVVKDELVRAASRNGDAEGS